MNYRVGLTGGIGSGKSTVAALFQELGATVIDSDVISHQLTKGNGAAMAPIREAFGETMLDNTGGLDRARMRQLIFSDPAAKLRLEAILHPLIRTQLLEQARAAADAAPYQMLVVPLLFEIPNYEAGVHRAVVVDCAEEIQMQRAIARSGLDEKTVRAIMASQVSRAERLRRADEIIHNEGNPDDLRPQVEQLHQRYLALCGGSL